MTSSAKPEGSVVTHRLASKVPGAAAARPEAALSQWELMTRETRPRGAVAS